MNEIKISIIIPTYNRVELLFTAIKSAMAQTVRPYEIVVVDDGSSEDIQSVTDSFEAEHLRYFRQERAGAPVARNRGLAEARGEYVLWLDSDDQLLPDCIMRHLANLGGRPDLDVSYGDLNICGENLAFRQVKTYEDWYGRPMELLGETILDNKIPNPGTLVKKSCYTDLGGFDEEFTRAQDYEFWTRLIPRAKVGHAGGVACNWRWHGGNMSSDVVDFDTSFDIKLIKRVLERYSLRELYPRFDWVNDPKACEALCLLRLANRFMILKDDLQALRYARKSLSACRTPQAMEIIRLATARLEAASAGTSA
jgi:glycosyltransferase involved in cell wall biosynthesis